MNNEFLLQTIENIENLLQTLKSAIQQPPKQAQAKKGIKCTSESVPAKLLGQLPNFNDELWPQAAPPIVIVKGEISKQFRAVQIAGLISLPMEGARVLEIGCGEGHVANELSRRAKNVVGYDLKLHSTWNDLKGPTFTIDKTIVNNHKPYDYIIMYDVLDHIERDDHTSLMAWASSLLAPDGRIFVRTHPWTSRHGSHLYETGLNKAFVHLALTADELATVGFDMPPNSKIVRPMAAYERIFRDAGLQVIDRKGHTSAVEPYFSDALLDRIINVTWGGKIEKDDALKIMSNVYIDYYLANS